MRTGIRQKIFSWVKTPVLWCLLLIAAAGLRLLFLYLNPVLPRDAVLYCRLMEILHHDGASSLLSFWETLNRHEAYWLPPLSLYILKLPMYFGLSANAAGIVVSLLSGVSLVFCVLLIGRKLFPAGNWYLWGAAFAAVHPSLVELSTQTIRDGLYLAVSGWMMYFLLRFLKKEKIWRSGAMILLLWPIAFMIRYEALEILSCAIVFCLICPKKGMSGHLLVCCGGLLASCLCFALISPVIRDYFLRQVPGRLLLYSSGQCGGSYARILFQKIPNGLFLPFGVSGSLGLFFLCWEHKTDRRVYCFCGTILFMLLWRVLFRINSTRYVNNMIIPCLMLSLYFVFYLYSKKNFSRWGQPLGVIVGIVLVSAGIGKTLHDNPYADSLLKICSYITAQPGDVQIFTNKEQTRLAYLSHRNVQSFTADDLTFLDKAKEQYLVVWYHPTTLTQSEDCMVQRKIMAGGGKEIFESFTNRKRKTTVTLYSVGAVPDLK